MKQRTKPTTGYTIKQVGDVFKVFDPNQRYRCGFGTREGAQTYIDQRTGKAPMPVPNDMTQAAPRAA